ncbi:hypothetical protein UCREL1_7723 [Eutypa lata UCREL1]|uniref:Uncharacterized protein n=1 Tax=Eutypa lata (strain UCR-EL1) TaxID=1287681 RepID=M7TF28_EUTLA|nr:hypothetical protein UCREL1_7723 [Eutypa lata UCREL1]
MNSGGYPNRNTMLAPGAPTVPKLVPTQGFTNTSIAPNTVSTRGFTGNCQPPSRHRTGQIGPPASMHANAGVPRPDQGTGQGGIPHMVPKAISVNSASIQQATKVDINGNEARDGNIQNNCVIDAQSAALFYNAGFRFGPSS